KEWRCTLGFARARRERGSDEHRVGLGDATDAADRYRSPSSVLQADHTGGTGMEPGAKWNGAGIVTGQRAADAARVDGRRDVRVRGAVRNGKRDLQTDDRRRCVGSPLRGERCRTGEDHSAAISAGAGMTAT